MPLYHTRPGLDHAAMRCDTLSFDQLRLRVHRIRDPQKMYEFVVELARRRSMYPSETTWRRLSDVAVEKLRLMGYNPNGTENGLPTTRWTSGSSRTPTRRRNANTSEQTSAVRQIAGELIRPSPASSCKLVLAPVTAKALFSSLTGIDFKAFVNILRSADVPWRIIAMSLGMTTTDLIPYLRNIGYTKQQIDEIMEQRSRAITTTMVRRITPRKENK